MKALLGLTVFLFVSLSATTSFSLDIENYNFIDLKGFNKDSTIEQYLSRQQSAQKFFAEDEKFQDMLGQLTKYCPTCAVVPKSMFDKFQPYCPDCVTLPSRTITCPEGTGWDSHQQQCRQFCDQ